MTSWRKREVLGEGPFSTVSAEWDPLLGRSVAVKELHPHCAQSEAFTRAFLSRAERLFDLDHENVLGIYRVGGREAPAVVRELAEGTLADTILAGPLPPPEVEAILRQALLGLQAMHEKGVAHGAVKPQNLFRRGERVKIGDFAVPGAPLVPTDPVHRYEAPERRYGARPSPGADLYSLGLVACELLLGASRFDELMRGDPRRITGLPPALSLALPRLLESTEADRANTGEILALLDGTSPTVSGAITPPALPALDTSALDARLRPEKPKPVVDVQKVKRAAAIAIAALLAGFAIVTFFFLRDQRPDEHRAPRPQPPPAKLTATPAPTPAAPQPTESTPTVAPPATPLPVPSPQPAPPSAVPATPPSAAPNAAKLQKTLPLPPAPGPATAKAPVQESPPAAEAAPPPREAAPPERTRPAPDPRQLIGEFLPSYDELGPLRSGQRAYVDQNATYADVPHSQGRYCIETANRDRKDGTVWFQLAREAKVFVAHDHEIERKPGWLKEFTPTSESWSVLLRNANGVSTDLIHFDVFVRTYPAGTVNLGPNQEKSFLGKMFAKGNMYLVCVEAQ